MDYGRLDAVSHIDAYRMPCIDLIDGIGSARFMSTLDMTRLLAAAGYEAST